MFTSIWKKESPEPADSLLLCIVAKQELEARIEQLLMARYEKNGAISLLEPSLRIVAIGERIELATEEIADAISEVKLRELPSVLAFLVVREENLAIPRDVVANIATEAARATAERINSLM